MRANVDQSFTLSSYPIERKRGNASPPISDVSSCLASTGQYSRELQGKTGCWIWQISLAIACSELQL